MKIKRGTTPTITVTIHAPFEGVKEVNFIFKDRRDEYGRTILTKEYKDNIPLKEGEDTKTEFKVLLRLAKEETLRFSVGKAYMDTEVVYSNGETPSTKIIDVDVEDTFFEGK
jgi:hypothetical protein